MTRSQQRILSQLTSSQNELASGLGQCLEALRLISALPRASPIYIQYANSALPAVKAFGREHLSRVPLRTVVALAKSSMGLPDNIRVTAALFYREDGSVDPAKVLVDEDSWKELAPYIHTLHVEDERPSTSFSSISLRSTSPTSTRSLNSSASTFVPLNPITIKTLDGTKVDLRKPSFSPSCMSLWSLSRR
ncbi:hypothetical protein PAXRUDRAFT_160498 [Paxillus rubicundulus Ve08.2h10]|uniref:Unplaced genomic scaffold scaffold_1379, whole genome shotgun sequence n=1 Tax=Paxillus rubicundulus Ve08.2h10 TaxID=930991 RepID=A0A0D0C9Z5_9AGAM|nr:hypothetical protein PAXRUDRAFT_160498 [Paxillus rubicundulus Ve08.2h10]